MLRGDLYYAMDLELVTDRQRTEFNLLQLNTTADYAERTVLLQRLLGSFGGESFIRSPFHCDYGYNIFLGCGVFLNFNCVLLDVTPIRIGDGTQIGPAVQIYSADHPRDRETRLKGLENGRNITIGKNCWIGGGATILPGVTIGDGAVVGAGSVVTRDVPAGVTIAGNPARPLPVQTFT